jgi:hypothetical protein
MTTLSTAYGDEHRPCRSVFSGQRVFELAGLKHNDGGSGPLFDEDVWDFTDVVGLPRMLNRPSNHRLNFSRITDPRWRLLAKEYLLALMAPGHDHVRVLPLAYRVPRSFSTCHKRLRELTTWLNWLTGEQVRSLADVTDRHCEKFKIIHSAPDADRINAAGKRIAKFSHSLAAAVIDLAFYGELFSTDRYSPGWVPWAGKSAVRVAGTGYSGENKTQPVAAEVLQPMLAAAFYIVEVLGPHLVELRRQTRRRAEINESRAGRGALGGRHQDAAAMRQVLDRHIAEDVPLERVSDANIAIRAAEGWDPDDPLFDVSFYALAREAGVWSFNTSRHLPLLKDRLEEAVAAVGVEHPWGRGAALVESADGSGQVPWTLPIGEQAVRHLGDFATTACIIVIAAVSGMRMSELAELRVGCRRPPEEIGPGLFRHRLASKVIKGKGFGGIDEEWVVVEEAYPAVALAEDLHAEPQEGDQLFTPDVFRFRYARFRAWVNSSAGERLGLDPIPEGPANLRMLRRILSA